MRNIQVISIAVTLLALFGAQSVSAQAITEAPIQAQYAPNEIIVQFASSYAPHTLQQQIDHEKSLQKTFSGQIQLFFHDQLRTLTKELSPNDHLQNIKTVSIKVGVLDMSPMFDVKGESQENTYLVKLDGSTSIEKAIDLYEGLAEVIYAQPNYLYELYSQ